MAANRKSSKTVQRPAIAERQRIQISPSVEIAKRFRLAAVSLNLSETELFERLIDLNFPGLHVQNLSKSPFFGAGQGGVPTRLTSSRSRFRAAPQRSQTELGRSADPLTCQLTTLSKALATILASHEHRRTRTGRDGRCQTVFLDRCGSYCGYPLRMLSALTLNVIITTTCQAVIVGKRHSA